MRAWRTHPEHVAAQKLGREKYYSEFSLQICEVRRQSKFNQDELSQRQAAPGRS